MTWADIIPSWRELIWLTWWVWITMSVVTATALSEACGGDHDGHVETCIIAGVGWPLTLIALHAEAHPEGDA
jgi:hypothetical protein